jgi:hypothetical protein
MSIKSSRLLVRVAVVTLLIMALWGIAASSVEPGAAQARTVSDIPAFSPDGSVRGAITTNCTGGAADGLVHDDGTFENGRGNIVTPLVELFNLPDPPLQVQQVCVCFTSSDGANHAFDIVFLADGATPGAELARFGPYTATSVPVYASYAWYDVPLTYESAGGPVFVGVDFADPDDVYLCGDTSAGTPPQENFYFDGVFGVDCGVGNWCAESYNAYGVRVEMGSEEQPVPGCDMFLQIPPTAAVGKFVENAEAYWSPGNLTDGPVILPVGQSAWVLGVDPTGQYYQVIWSCDYLWVRVETMGPNFDNTWQGTLLPTEVIEVEGAAGGGGGGSAP